MIAYILNNEDLTTRDILQFGDYDFARDSEYSEKSTIGVGRAPNIQNDDFVLCTNEQEQMFIGICESFSSADDKDYTITLEQKEMLFDRSIFAADETIISEKGIEDFIKNEIDLNWFDEDDALLSKKYLRDNGVSTVTCLTHTPINDTINGIQVSLITENEINAEYNYRKETQIYNLKDFLSSIREKYQIFVDFEFYKSTAEVGNPVKLRVKIYKDSSAALPIDTTISDVADYDEQYDVDALAKLITNWKQPDGQKGTDYDELAYAGPCTMPATTLTKSFRQAATIAEVDVEVTTKGDYNVLRMNNSGTYTDVCSIEKLLVKNISTSTTLTNATITVDKDKFLSQYSNDGSHVFTVEYLLFTQSNTSNSSWCWVDSDYNYIWPDDFLEEYGVYCSENLPAYGATLTITVSSGYSDTKVTAKFNSSLCEVSTEAGVGDRILFMINGKDTDEYDYSQTYDVGDYCTHENAIYVCSTAVETPMAWDASYWTSASTADVTCSIYVNGELKADDEATLSFTTNVSWILFNSSTFVGKFYYATFKDNFIVTNPVIAYSSSSTYNTGDYCIYNGSTYRCTTTISTAEAWNSSHWKIVNAYNSSTVYTKDDSCIHNGKIYTCEIDMTAAEAWNDFHWKLRTENKGITEEIVPAYNNNSNIYTIYNKNAASNPHTQIQNGCGNIIGDTKKLKYYLQSDETITRDPSSTTRMDGITESFYLESDSAPEMYQQVVNKFESDSYEHKISFRLYSESHIYPMNYYYVGRKVTVKTKTGVKTSIITSIRRSSDDSYLQIVLGKLKVSLIEKLRSK